MNLDWGRLKAVVFESDDWGLCAWSADEDAHRALAGTPAFRSPAGRAYARSTLESAADVRLLAATLLEFRGGDGVAPAWQANTVMAAPDYAGLAAPRFDCDALPLVFLPETPARWRRPGMWAQVEQAIEAGAWWPELHGLHHLPEHAWLSALRRGDADALAAFEAQCLVCAAVEASGEFDPSEPADRRSRGVALAVERFGSLFGRAPSSLCPPDYRWDERLEDDAGRLGVTTLQGHAERAGPLPRLRRLIHRHRWPLRAGARFYLPPRIAFEPRGTAAPGAPLGAAAAHRAVRAAWRRGQPAIVSTHRLNYAHLDAAWSEAGRAALRDLLSRLTADGAWFLTDAEVRQLLERGWSARPVATRGALVRSPGASATVRFPAPAGVTGASSAVAGAALEGREVVVRLERGAAMVEWRRE
ncbi:MAG: hypothetical protein HZC42_07855 [Candidatus Eisenbacteria bacterium]|nr:hypothetical protein [Candidatus Eisenbacteria bacterium]